MLVIAGLTCATLLVLHRRAEIDTKDQVKDETGNVILTFQVMQQQHQISLNHTADLLATVASMRNGDVTTINEAGEDPGDLQIAIFWLWPTQADIFWPCTRPTASFPLP